MNTPPHWDLSSIYTSVDDPKIDEDIKNITNYISDLNNLLNTPTNLQDTSALIEHFIEIHNQVTPLFSEIIVYLNCLIDTDSTNSKAKTKLSEIEPIGPQLTSIEVTFTHWVRAHQDEIEILQSISKYIKEHYFYINELMTTGQFLMSPEQETFCAELNLSGWNAWNKLHTTVVSQVTVDFENQQLPITKLLGIQWHDPNENRRKVAYEAELAAWKTVVEPLAGALNSIKGSTITINKYRGRNTVLDAALADSRIDKPTLDALLSAIHANLPLFQKYLKHKAKQLGRTDGKLKWYDLKVPLSSNTESVDWNQAKQLLDESVGTFSHRFKSLIDTAFTNHWIDAQPRVGKRAGAYCTRFSKTQESRILANFNHSLSDVLTLAHELGHAYHNQLLFNNPPDLRHTPMILAETASIFAETLMLNHLLNSSDLQTQYTLRASSIDDKIQVLVDIYCRYLFESEIFEKRVQAELSAKEICDSMTKYQRLTYSDALDEHTLHPYMWTWKPHYYDADRPFYNFPYAFGQLFALSLYQHYSQSPQGFVEQYEKLLTSTGKATPAQLAQIFNLDLSQPQIWLSGIESIRTEIDQWIATTPQTLS